MASNLGWGTEDLTICSICQKKYTEPKRLPCLHTFCQPCLSEYITSSINENTSKEKGFLCPTCKSFTPTPKEGVPNGKWAEQFATNLFILGLLNTENAQKKEKVCDWCCKADKENTAEHWCRNCTEALCSACRDLHFGIKYIKEHNIVRLDDVNVKGIVLSSPDLLCTDHANKTIEFYCKYHEVQCCAMCMFLNHKHCTNVLAIDEASSGICDSDDFNSVVHNFQSLRQTFQTGIADRQSKRTKLEESRSRVENKITRIRCRINKHLDKIEKELRQEVTSAYEKEIDTVSAQEQAFHQRMCIADNCTRVMEVGKEKMSDVLNLIELRNLKLKQEELSDFTQSEKAKLKDIDFELFISLDISEFETSLTSLGELVEAESPEAQAPVAKEESCGFHSATPELISTVSIKGCISGATFMPNQTTLIVNCTSINLTLLARDGSLMSSFEPPSEPWGVALISPNEAVVTLSSAKQLAFISIDDQSRSLTLSRTVNLTGECRGICRLGDTLLVTYPKQLVTLDLCGNLIKTVDINAGHLTSVVAFDNDNIFLLDSWKHCVLCVDKDGNEKSIYSPDDLEYPKKITVDSAGNVYITGWGRHNIHQLTRELKFVRLLPVTIRYPLCIEFEEHSNRFLVSSGSTKTLSFFEMKNSV